MCHVLSQPGQRESCLAWASGRAEVSLIVRKSALSPAMVACEGVKSVIWQVTCVHAWSLLKVSNIAGGSEISHGATGAAGTRRVS